MLIDLRGKRAMVCGSTGGIGKAIAGQMAGSGAEIILVARNEEKLKATLKELSVENGQNHSYILADFSNPSELEKSVQDYLNINSQPIHILVNNTGGPPAGPIAEAEPEAFRIAFNSHLICNHILATALLPAMKKEAYGRIINIISTSVKIPLHGLGVSNTIRGAVGNWSKTLANETARFGITVNNILPGATETERLSQIFTGKAAKTGKEVEEIQAEMLSEIPANRFARPSEPASAATFLASPLASYITGINLPVDGGRTGCL